MISVKDIKEILGEVSYSLRDLCRSSHINKWSLFKPINSDSRTPLTDDDFKDLNFGYENYTATLTFAKDSRSNLWNYSPIHSPYRLSDFKKYNHYYNFINFYNDGDSTINSGGRVMCSFFGDIHYMVNNFDAFKDARTSSTPIYLCILLMNSNSNGYIYRVSEINNYDDEDIRFYAVNVPDGNYTVIPVLTYNYQVSQMSDGNITLFQNMNGKYWTFPEYCEFELEIITQSEDFFDNVVFNFSNVDYNYNNYNLSNFSVTSEIVNHSADEYNISLTMNYSNTIQGTVVMGTHSCTLNSSISSDTKYITNTNTYETVTDAQLNDGIIPFTINATITCGNISQQKQWAIILEKGM